MGAEGDLVGCTNYCKPTKKLPIVASAIKVNVEKVIALKPDLVLASTLTPNETLQALKKMKINTVVFPMTHSYAEICSQFLQLGKLVGKEDNAKKVLEGTNKKVSALRAKKPSSRKVFIELGANPLIAVIPNTFMDDYITFAGAKNIIQNKNSCAITRESVLLQNPDAIFIVTMGVLADKEKKEWERYPNLSAVRNHKIFIIDSDKACTPTPITFVETLETIIKDLK